MEFDGLRQLAHVELPIPEISVVTVHHKKALEISKLYKNDTVYLLYIFNLHESGIRLSSTPQAPLFRPAFKRSVHFWHMAE